MAETGPTSKKIDFFEKSSSKNHCLNIPRQRFFDLSVYNFFTRISLRNFAGVNFNEFIMCDLRETRSEQMYVDILSNGGFKAFFGDENNKEEVIGFLILSW